MRHAWPAHGGPQKWQDLRRGIVNRKETIRRRNQQIRDLKKRIEALETALAKIAEWDGGCECEEETCIYAFAKKWI